MRPRKAALPPSWHGTQTVAIVIPGQALIYIAVFEYLVFRIQYGRMPLSATGQFVAPAPGLFPADPGDTPLLATHGGWGV
jgi:hypothetical protein